jgi:hypothetical protein
MKAFSKRISLLLLGITLVTIFLSSGCATREDDSYMGERPWNAPKSWETGVPQGMMQGR